MIKRFLSLSVVFLSLATFVPVPLFAADAEHCDMPECTGEWKSIISAKQLKEQLADPKLILIDVRSADKYTAAHIPGSINIPGDAWRTAPAKGGKGSSQDIFVDPAGKPDVKRYEKFLGTAGLARDNHVVIYGEHAGKADGSVPAMILHWLGQEKVQFLDGVGVEQWKAAGFELTKEPRKLAVAQYEAKPAADFVWALDQVLANLSNQKVLFYDTRSPKEFTGADLRDNKHGGHIPGAVLLNYEDLLTKERTTVTPEQARKILEEKKITPDKKIVLYCQTATRVSLPYLVLKDLGFKDVAIYDASWHEYGNRNDTPIVKPTDSNVK